MIKLVLLSLLNMLFVSSALAVDWKDLTTQEQSVLQSLSGEWNQLSVPQQQKLQLGANLLI